MPIQPPDKKEKSVDLSVPEDSDCSIEMAQKCVLRLPKDDPDKRHRPPLTRANTPKITSSSPHFGSGFIRTDVTMIGAGDIIDSSVDMEEIANAFRKDCRTDEPVINGYSLGEKLGEGFCFMGLWMSFTAFGQFFISMMLNSLIFDF